MIKIVIVLSTLISVSLCQLNCTWANGLDCTTYQKSTECGTDGVTYTNRCYFTQAYCKDRSLHIFADTDCASAGLTTPKPIVSALPTGSLTTLQHTGPTTTRAPIFLGHNAVMDFFCRELSHSPCQNDTEQVCGSDSKTYENVCEFEKQRCTHRSLTVKSYGACLASGSIQG